MAISDEERTAFRLTVARRETPRALAVAGGCFVAITLVNELFGPPMATSVLVLNAVVAVLLLGGAALAHSTRMRVGAWPWLAMVCALALVLVGQVQVWRSPDGSAFAYVLLIMVAYAPFTLAWAPAALAAGPMVIGAAVVSRQWPAAEATDWVIAAVAAVAIGMSLLWVRLRSVDEMADLTSQVKALATRDRLTGAFNRHGVEERIPELVGAAARMQSPVFVTFLDVVGLKRINDRYGHQEGDAVILTVAEALRASARSADIVSRWGGDEFIVLGIGIGQDPDEFRERMRGLIRLSPVDARIGPLDVSVGTASMGPDALDIHVLIGQADEDMYDRRRAERSG